MEPEIPVIVETLYRYFVTQPDPRFWPDYFKKDPVHGHGLWAFYQGLRHPEAIPLSALFGYFLSRERK